MTLLILFLAIAAALTFAMFQSKQSMLGWPAYAFWAFGGFQAYSLRTGLDIYFWLAFFCLLGGLVFTALAAFGLRKQDSFAIGDYDDEASREEKSGMKMPKEEGESEEPEQSDGMSHLENNSGQIKESSGTQRLHARAENRRTNQRGRSTIRW